MGTYAANILPNTTGLNLGSSSQQWDAFVRNLNVSLFISQSVNPSQSGVIRLAGADSINWRSAENNTDYAIAMSTVAQGTIPTNTLVWFGQAFSSNAFIDHTATNPAASGMLRGGNLSSIAFRSNNQVSDVPIISMNSSDQVVVGGIQGIFLNGPITTSDSVTTLDSEGITSTLTGDSTEHTLFSYTLPAGKLPVGKSLRITFAASHLTGSNNVTYRLYFGNALFAVNNTASGSSLWTAVIKNVASNSQAAFVYPAMIGTTAVAGAAISLAIDTTQAVVIKGTVAAISPDTYRGELALVELLR